MRTKFLIGSVLTAGVLALMGLAAAAIAGAARDQEKTRLQELTGMEANDFKFQWENYSPPNEAQVKTLLEGGKAKAQSAGQIEISEARLKTFSTNGTLEMLAETPKCILDSVQKTVRSSSPLQVRSTDGRFFLEGEGFLLQHTNSHLIISNRVHTVLRYQPDQAPMP